MTQVKQVSEVKGPGMHTSLYGMVNNIVDVSIVSDADTVFVTSARDGVLRSMNQGITFAPMPGLDTLGKARALTRHAGELVAVRENGTVLRTEQRRAWRPVLGIDSIMCAYRVGVWLVLQTTNRKLIAVDERWATADTLDGALPDVKHPSVSSDDTQIMAVANKMLYRVTASDGKFRVDSVPLPSDREWRGVSVLGTDLVLLAGRNEVWWGTFDEPLQVRSAMSGTTDRRIVSMDLSDIGVVVGFRGTDQSVFLNIKNSNGWEPLFRAAGEAVNDVIWTYRSGGQVFAGVRDGGIYRLASDRRALLDVASPFNEINILSVHGTYPNKLVTMYDGRILWIESCRATPALIASPVPFSAGLRVLDASHDGWYIHDPVQGLFRTTDAGTSWTRPRLSDTLGYPEVLYALKNDLYLYASRALWYSSDDGTTWSCVLAKGDTAYAVRRIGGKLVSISFNGWNWIRRGRPLETITPPVRLEDHRVFLFEVGGNVMAILTESALYVSNDDGKTWGSIAMSRDAMFPYMHVAGDRVFTLLPGTGLMMFDVYSDRPDDTP
ncbi:MAG: hypothetical protein FGM24_00335 [Candidatus Kapabacteria bacterium]|nr:hypothetical protein [Candidatus Kapabacteria bacterium]